MAPNCLSDTAIDLAYCDSTRQAGRSQRVWPQPPKQPGRKHVEATRLLFGERGGVIIQGGVCPTGAILPSQTILRQTSHPILWPIPPRTDLAAGTEQPSSEVAAGITQAIQQCPRCWHHASKSSVLAAGTKQPISVIAAGRESCRAARWPGRRGGQRAPHVLTGSKGVRAKKIICQLLTTFDIRQLLTIGPCPMFMSTNDNRVKGCPVG